VTQTTQQVDQLCINSIRSISIDAIEQANSGHPGLPLGAAPMAYVLWQRHLRFDPNRPEWPNRDRFVLSAGHGSMLLYALLHFYGFGLERGDLENFRQWQSKTPGHPELGWTPGVEATTGPLGQGTANSVGMALAERWLAARFNRPGHAIIDHHSYALVSDGDLMEGIAYEAASLAAQWKLGKLIWLYDANDVSLDGPLSLSFDRENVAARFEAQGWHVQRVEDGDHDLEALDAAIAAARAESTMPSLVVVKTTIGFGSPNKAGTAAAHGSPLGKEEAAKTKRELGWDVDEKFQAPRAARDRFLSKGSSGKEDREAWDAKLKSYGKTHPELAEDLRRALRGVLPTDWRSGLPIFESGEKMATRVAGGKVLQYVAARIPWLMGGDADLSCSTKTAMESEESQSALAPGGRNLHFGVREHAMAAIANGMAYHGGVRPYVSTFFCFSDYMRPAVRLAALAELPVIYVWTHDSVAVGEDGPTHQPIEHLMSLRAMPHLHVYRPGDANETAAAWACAMERMDGPSALVLSRQNLPVLGVPPAISAEGVRRGAYVALDADAVQALVIATGSELHVAIEAAGRLKEAGIGVRVVSMPCWERFAQQDKDYRDSVLPPSMRCRVSIEAGATLGWERWLGGEGIAVGIDRFGASAPGDEVLQRLGIHAETVVDAVRRQLD
jgi:transketolase